MVGDSIGFEEVVVDVGVASLNPAIYNPAVGDPAAKAFITAEGGAMRYFVNGQNPSAASGVLLEEGDIVELPSIYHIKDFRVIKAGNDDGKITVTYEG